MGTFPALRASSLKQRTPMELLQDNYIFGGVDSGKWIVWGTLSVLATTNLDLEIVSANGYTDYGGTLSKRTYDLTSSYAFSQLLDAGSQVSGLEVYPVELSVGANALSVMIAGNTVFARRKINGSYGTVGSTVAYNSTTMKWFRVRETDGTIYWEYAADPTSTWTIIAQDSIINNPFPITALIGGSTLGTWTTVAVTTAKFANFNVLPNQYQFSWKGLTWNKRIHIGDPASNTPMSVENVSLPDANNYLTFTLSNPNLNNPVGTEIFSDQRGFGYGTYIVTIGTELDTMDHRVGWGGLFTFDFTAAPDYKEIDVDETRDYGGNAAIQLLHTVTWNNAGVRNFNVSNQNVDATPVQTHRLIWTAGQIKIDTFAGVGVGGTLLFSTTVTTNVPTPGLERVHFNIWNNTGVANYLQAPTTQVVVQDFSFTPAGTAYTQTLTEAVSTTDTLLKTPGKILSDAITSTDTLIKVAGKVLSEATSISDVLLKQTGRAFSEAVTNTDTLLKTAGKMLSEATSITASFIRGKIFSEAITNTDTLLKLTGRALTEATVISDTLIKTPSRIFIEAVTNTDVLIKQLGRIFLESVTNTASLIKGRIFSEATSLTDTLIKGPTKVLSEAITATDSLIKITGKFLIEAITNTDTFAGSKVTQKTLSETVAVADSVIKTIGRNLSEAITHTDSILKQTGKILSEATSLTDTLKKLPGKILSEAITASDVMRKIPGKVLADSITTTDSIVKIGGKVLSEAITTTDTLIKSIGKTFTEAITYTDTLIRTFSRTLIESVTHTDVLIIFKFLSRVFSETISFTDIISIIKKKVITLSEAIRFIDRIGLNLNGQDWYIKLMDTFGNPKIWFSKLNKILQKGDHQP